MEHDDLIVKNRRNKTRRVLLLLAFPFGAAYLLGRLTLNISDSIISRLTAERTKSGSFFGRLCKDGCWRGCCVEACKEGCFEEACKKRCCQEACKEGCLEEPCADPGTPFISTDEEKEMNFKTLRWLYYYVFKRED